MKHLNYINEFWSLFQKDKTPVDMTIDLLTDLLSSDLENYTYKFYNCHFEANDTKPKFTDRFGDGIKTVNIYGQLPGRGDNRSIIGKGCKKGIILLSFVDDGAKHGEIYEIEKSINRKRLRSYGIDFVLTKLDSYSGVLFYTIGDKAPAKFAYM